MAKFDFDKPVASFSWYLQNGSADDKRGNRLHVGTGQNAQIYFDPKSGELSANCRTSAATNAASSPPKSSHMRRIKRNRHLTAPWDINMK